MNRINPAFAVILFSATLGACDRPDTEDGRALTPSESEVSNVAASTDNMPSPDRMAPANTASNGMTSDSMASDRMAPPDGMRANGATSVDGSSDADRASAGRPTAAGSADADFYRRALGSGTSEVALSEHASRTSSSTEVKRVANMLIADHRVLNGKLRAASGMNDVTPLPADAKAVEEVKSKTAAAFDVAYLQKMSDGHKKSIKLYEAASTAAGDAETRKLALAALPKLREHAGHIEKTLTTANKNR